jgi:hypothetical protein
MSWTSGPTRDPYSTLFSWTLTTGRAAGVHGDKHRAVTELHAALRDAPVGAEGEVREVLLDGSGDCSYVDVRLVSHAQHAAQGQIVWADLP